MYKNLVLLILFVSCKTNTTDGSISPEAANYIDEVITIVKSNSINRDKINWTSFKTKVFAKAGNAKSIEDTYPAIHYAIKLLGDGHSYFAPVTEDNYSEKEPPILDDEKVPNDIGYLRVRYCMGNAEQKQKFTDVLLNDIKQRDKEGLKGWIVDLRGNFGGDMSPMLLGVNPILGEGTMGYTIYPDGKIHSWNYNQGRMYYDDVDDAEVKVDNPYRLINPDPFVAVLTDTLTASSGEAVTVAFKGRRNTKSFGFKTYGVPTSNQKFQLSDGSNMLITVAVFADRNKKKYNTSIEPDTIIEPVKALEAAIKWLQLQNTRR